MDTLPVALIAAVTANILSQIIKIFIPVFRGKPPVWSDSLKSGGMPSAHTATCAAVALTAGLREGFSSTTFAIAAILTAVVAHDAVKVRGTLNTIIRILRQTVSPEVLEQAGSLPDSIGHNTAEVIAGLLLGAVVALPCHLLLP